MGKKPAKATKKIAAKGQLKKAIQTRHKHQQIKRKVQNRKAGKIVRIDWRRVTMEKRT
jgi:nucleolar complex protein 2